MTLAVAVVATYAPVLSLAAYSAYADWKFDTSPPDGLDDITFPMNMANSPHREGYYFAQQYGFLNISDIGYTGLQPRPDSNGSIVHAAFSTFQPNSKTSHPRCYDGADGGPGVSCAIDINGDYSHTYNIVVENIGADTWRGTLVDTVTNEVNVIGEWTLPPGSGKLRASRDAFVEYYLSDVPPSVPCNDVPKAEVTFGNPTTNTSGASAGYFTKWYEHEPWQCKGDIGFEATNATSGLNVKVGFPGATSRSAPAPVATSSPPAGSDQVSDPTKIQQDAAPSETTGIGKERTSQKDPAGNNVAEGESALNCDPVSGS